MAPKMLSSLSWLSAECGQAVLNTVSHVLKGEVPCSGQKLSAALKSCADADCQGVLQDAEFRKGFADGVSSLSTVSADSAAQLVEACCAALERRVAAIHEKAAKLEKDIPSKGKSLPTFAEVCAAMPKGQAPGDALKGDWVLWHFTGIDQYPKLLPVISEKLLRERLSLAACAGSGPVSGCALAAQVLDNLEAYIAYENSITGSQVQPQSIQVCSPFGEKAAKETAVRRVLLQAGIPSDLAASIAEDVVAGRKKLACAVQELAAAAKSSAVLPMYVAPPAPKEPKQKKEGGKDASAGAAPDKGAKTAKGGTAPTGAEAIAATSGPLGEMYVATAAQELQWALLSYRVHSKTTLGEAASAGGDAGSAQASRPAGFAGVWAPDGSELPPGHTPYSWVHAKPKGMTEFAFARTWEPTSVELPPGHTPYSWEKVSGSMPGASPQVAPAAAASTQPAAPAAAAAAPAATAATASKAPAAKAEASPAATADGSLEGQMHKLDIRCGRIVECGRVPDADSLYLLKINIGDETRQVVSSLVKHYKEVDLVDRQVVVYCNIKPGKMRGYESQAMVLAACKDKGADNEVCQLLQPPKGAKEGTKIRCGAIDVGCTSKDVSVKNISKVWGSVQPLFKVNDKKEATFQGVPWTFPEGSIHTESVTDVGIY